VVGQRQNFSESAEAQSRLMPKASL